MPRGSLARGEATSSRAFRFTRFTEKACQAAIVKLREDEHRNAASGKPHWSHATSPLTPRFLHLMRLMLVEHPSPELDKHLHQGSHRVDNGGDFQSASAFDSRPADAWPWLSFSGDW